MVPPPPPVLSNPWLGTWSRPPDRPSQIVLALAIGLLAVAVIPGGRRWLMSTLEPSGIGELKRRRRFLAVACFVAAFLSLGYIAFYLRGGPRASDAATYWLQGRALSHGQLAWTAPDPTASFRAQNLAVPAPDRLAGIFPPGYPLLLGAMFLLGAPMLIGPLVAAGLVVATWLLTRELATAARVDEAGAERIARVAVGFSIVSAALRYHTADALPHGAAALGLTMALACAMRALRTGKPRVFAAAGLALGLLIATEPMSAIAGGVAVLALAACAGDRGRSLLWACAAAAPGVLLLLAANRAATGHAFGSPGALHALGAKATVLATAHRLRSNLVDVANFEPIALLPVLLLRPAVRKRSGAALWAVGVVLLQVLILAPFASATGDDVAPGAGAQVLADVLPVEHALVALALGLSFPRRLVTATIVALALALGGFALHASHEHERLATSGLGRPHFEPDIPREGAVTHGLLFFDDDQGFELAFHPGALASHGIEAVRMRNDDHDRLLYDLLGHPPTHRYTTGPAGPTGSTASWWSPSGGDSWRFEAESDLPPVARSGRAEVVLESESCASNGRALTLEPAEPSTSAVASVTLELPIPRAAAAPTRQAWTVTPRAFRRGGPGAAELTLVTTLGGPPLAQWTWTDASQPASTCIDLPSRLVDLGGELGGDNRRAWLVMTARGGAVSLDKTTMKLR